MEAVAQDRQEFSAGKSNLKWQAWHAALSGPGTRIA